MLKYLGKTTLKTEQAKHQTNLTKGPEMKLQIHKMRDSFGRAGN